MSAQKDACVNLCTVVGSCLCSSGGSLLLSLVGLSVVDSIKRGRAVVALDEMSYGGTGCLSCPEKQSTSSLLLLLLLLSSSGRSFSISS